MPSFPILTSMISDQSMSALVLIGLVAFAGGIGLMFLHKQHIDDVFARSQDLRIRLFEKRKYRRRSLASTMIAAMGILMSALYWAHEPSVFIGLVSIILILLMAVMFLACLDLMSVSIHTATHDDSSARKEMINEYLRQREKLLERVENSNENAD